MLNAVFNKKKRGRAEGGVKIERRGKRGEGREMGLREEREREKREERERKERGEIEREERERRERERKEREERDRCQKCIDRMWRDATICLFKQA